MYRNRMSYKDQYVLVLMAVCYAAFGEKELCRRCLVESKQARQPHKYFIVLITPHMFVEYSIRAKYLLDGTSDPDMRSFGRGLKVEPFEKALLW